MRITAVIFALTAMVGLVATSSYAADRYGVACLENRTHDTINFSFKVGDGRWKSRSLDPGDGHRFSHKYDRLDERTSPSLRIRFDTDRHSGRRFTAIYKVSRGASVGRTCDEAKLYAFEYEPGNKTYIVLNATNGGRISSE